MVLLDAAHSLLIRAEPKRGLDLTKPVRRKCMDRMPHSMTCRSNGLHLDIDGVAADHLDVVC